LGSAHFRDRTQVFDAVAEVAAHLTYLIGIDARTWWHLLRENRFDVDRQYSRRVALVTAASLLTAVFSRRELRRYGSAIRATEVPAPIFVLGHWRSGTSYLHRLLTLDPRFAFPTMHQCIHPHTFLVGDRFVRERYSGRMPENRLVDEMDLGLDTPFEDEFAIANMTGYSMLCGVTFPRNSAYYERYLTLRDVSNDERTRWQRAFTWFLKKVTMVCKKPLVLKSPNHTYRIRAILSMYPDAKFIHIYRNPYRVYQSMTNLYHQILEFGAVQVPSLDDMSDSILRRYADMYDAFFEDVVLVDPRRICHVQFEKLERDPVHELRRIYQHLDLGGFDQAAGPVDGHIRKTRGYTKNSYPPLDVHLRDRITTQWSRSFQHWEYQPEAS
jgi:hypothetical protein